MTVKELKEKLKDVPDTMEVFIGERVTEFNYGLVNSAGVKNVLFYDDGDPDNEDVQAYDDVFVLTEE